MKQTNQPRMVRGAIRAEVPVRVNEDRAFLAQVHGRPDGKHVIGGNGIRWKIER